MNPASHPKIDVRSGNGSRKSVTLTCVPQTETKTNRPSEQTIRKEKRKRRKHVLLFR